MVCVEVHDVSVGCSFLVRCNVSLHFSPTHQVKKLHVARKTMDVPNLQSAKTIRRRYDTSISKHIHPPLAHPSPSHNPYFPCALYIPPSPLHAPREAGAASGPRPAPPASAAPQRWAANSSAPRSASTRPRSQRRTLASPYPHDSYSPRLKIASRYHHHRC